VGEGEIDYLLLGHVTVDRIASGTTVGGTVTYGARVARQLGRVVGAVTSCGPDWDVAAHLPGVQVRRVPAPTTTTFVNTYRGHVRQQWIEAFAAPIRYEDVPPAWRDCPIVHLAPLVDEIDHSLARCFPRSLVGVTPQGWLRAWDAQGKVRPKPFADYREVLPAVDVLVLSIEDVGGDWEVIEQFASAGRTVIATQGAEGATVFHYGERRQFPAFPTTEVDPTGAGDVFAVAYLVAFQETGDPWESAVFANCAASFAVEAPGPGAIPSRAQVEARLRQWRR
jgi:hypothetical protein